LGQLDDGAGPPPHAPSTARAAAATAAAVSPRARALRDLMAANFDTASHGRLFHNAAVIVIRSTRAALPIAIAALAGACGSGGSQPQALTRAQLMDPAACMTCHPQQYSDWSRSMHAYASDDPVFQAMNQRGQRETQGALGDFCVKCHAPVAVAEGLTHDGSNLAALPPSAKGVTCFFCHSASAIEGTHNNPLVLASDGSLFGPFADPAPGSPHKVAYSPLFDLARRESADACGGCHDIVNQHGAAVERTYAEWQGTVFADPAAGLTCVRCHMNQTQGPASTMSIDRIRALGSHALPGVDVAVTPTAQADAARAEVQGFLDSELQGTLCLGDDLRIEVTLDNVGAGHSFPSGATPDRRLWVALTAWAGDRMLYQTGVVPVGQSVETLADPDLWLIRDCLYDQAGAPTNLFWDAATVGASNQIPGAVKQTVLDPSTFTRSHLRYLYPVAGPLGERPDRITLQVFIKPIGDDVLGDLVASGDLDPAIAAAVPQLTIGGGAAMEWTVAAARPPRDIQTGATIPGRSCVGTEAAQYRTIKTVATSRARCQP